MGAHLRLINIPKAPPSLFDCGGSVTATSRLLDLQESSWSLGVFKSAGLELPQTSFAGGAHQLIKPQVVLFLGPFLANKVAQLGPWIYGAFLQTTERNRSYNF